MAGLDSLQRAIWRVLATIIAIGLYAYFGAAADLKSRVIAVLTATVAFSILFVLFFLWHFAVVPAKMDKEARDTIENLKGPAEEREKRERARKLLWQLREEGVAIRNEGFTTRTVDSWTEKFERWHAKVLEQADILSMDLRHALDPIDKIAPESDERVAVNNAIHQKNVSVMSEMLVRLYNYLDRTGS